MTWGSGEQGSARVMGKWAEVAEGALAEGEAPGKGATNKGDLTPCCKLFSPQTPPGA